MTRSASNLALLLRASTYTRGALVASLFAAFAVHAQAARTADSVGDTQSQVRSVLEGTRSDFRFGELRTAGVSSHSSGVQESTRQLLLGIRHVSANTPVAVGRNGNDDVQKRTQRVVLGRPAS